MRAELSSRGQVPAPSRRSWWAELTQNRIIALVLAMIIAVPLLAAPSDRSYTGAAAISLEVFALLLMTALLWRAKWDLRAENVRRFFGTGANVPVLMLLGLITLSCFWSPSKLFSIQELLRTGSGILLYFVVAYQFRQSKHLSQLVSVLLTLAAVVSIGGIAQNQLLDGERAASVFGNSQPLSSFLMLLLPTVVALAWTDKNTTRRVVAMVVSVLMVSCLMLTLSRSAWMGAIAGLLMLAYLAKQTATEKSVAPLRARKYQLVLPVLAIVSAVAFAAILKSQNTVVGDRAAASSLNEYSWQWRSHAWQGALKMVEAKPLTGWGAGMYPVYQHEFTGLGEPISLDGSGVRITLAEQAHNLYLQTAAELGIPGLLLTIAIFVLFVSAGIGRVGQLEPGIRRTLLMGSTAATVAVMVDALSTPSWQYGQTSMFLWLMLGVGTSCLRPRVKREEAVVQSHTFSKQFTLISRPMAAGLFLVFVTLLPTAYSSAQVSGYESDGTNGGRTAFAIAAGAGGAALLVGVLTGAIGTGAAVSAGAGAGADAGAGAGTGGTSSGGSVYVPYATPTPTPTPALAP